MDIDDMVLVSVDDHVVEPPHLFEGRLPAKYVDLAPKFVTRDDGTNAWVYEGQEIANVALNAVAGRPPEEYGIEPTSFDELRAGCYDIDERVKDMNANGVLGSLCFPSFPQFCGQLFARTEDKDVALAMVRAYNDWHIEDWCGTYPGRFIPLRAPRHLGSRGPGRRGPPDRGEGRPRRHLLREPLQARLAELPLRPLGPLLAGLQRRGRRRLPAHRLVVPAGDHRHPTRPIDCLITLTPMNIVQAAADLVWSPVLRKFPDLKIALSEGGIGWIPYFLERIDYNYRPPPRLDRSGLRRQAAQRGLQRAHPDLLHRRQVRHGQPPVPQPGPRHVGVRLPALGLDLAVRPRGAVGPLRRRDRRTTSTGSRTSTP